MKSFLLCLLFAYSAMGLIMLREGYKNYNEKYPEYVNMNVDEVKDKLGKLLPGTTFKEFDSPHPSEFYNNGVGLIVKDGVVIEPPHYFASVKIVDDWTPYVGKPFEEVVSKLRQKDSTLKFEILFNTKRVYSDINGVDPFVTLYVDEHGDLFEPKDGLRELVRDI